MYNRIGQVSLVSRVLHARRQLLLRLLLEVVGEVAALGDTSTTGVQTATYVGEGLGD